jgi:hypothetical protein
MKQLNEGLHYHDMENQITPILGIDQFKSKIGDDSEIIVLNFIVKYQAVGEDLVDWLERGYDWIIDAEVSPGEVLDGKFYVYAEMNRRGTAPRRIIEMLEDLETLTDISIDNWKIKIDDKTLDATRELLEQHMILNASEYKRQKDADLNEWREIAGLPQVNNTEYDDDIKAWQRTAGII